MPKKTKIPFGRWERGFALAKIGLSAGLRSTFGRLQSDDGKAETNLKLAELLVQRMGLLKGGALKIGQMISVYGEHYFPEEVSRVLRAMQAQNHFMPWVDVEKRLKKELGAAKLRQLLIEPTPIAAASIGQVHRGKILKTDEEIVLKIQYPDIERAIEQDLKFLKSALSFVSIIPNLPALDDFWVEVQSMLNRELDYKKEAKELKKVAKYLENDPFFLIPRPFEEFSSGSVLAMSYIESTPLVDKKVMALSQNLRNQIGEKILDLFFRELFEWRSIQTDAHFGNFGIRIGEKEAKNVQVVLFDYGAVREMGKNFVENYRDLLRSVVAGDRKAFEGAAKVMNALEDGDGEDLKEDFFKLCKCICQPFLTKGEFPWKNSGLPEKVAALSWDLVKKYPLRAPPAEVVFLNRKMGGLFTILARLDTRVSGREILDRYL